MLPSLKTRSGQVWGDTKGPNSWPHTTYFTICWGSYESCYFFSLSVQFAPDDLILTSSAESIFDTLM